MNVKVTVEMLNLYRRVKLLFKQNRQSLGNREMTRKVHEDGFTVGRFRVRTVMNRLGLKVTQRVAYQITTKRKHSDAVANNLLNQNFNPVAPLLS